MSNTPFVKIRRQNSKKKRTTGKPPLNFFALVLGYLDVYFGEEIM